MDLSVRLRNVLVILLLGVARQADADFVLSLNDTGAAGIEVIIADNAVAGTMTALGASTHGDSDPTAGQIGVPVGLTAGSFLVDPATSAFNIGGGPTSALIDLLLFVESTAPGTLEAMISATNLTLDDPAGSITGTIGGFSSPATGPTDVTFTVGYDPGNGSFTFPGGSTAGPVSIGGDVFGTTITTPVTGSNPFSLSQNVTITSSGGGQIIGFDASNETHPVPEPSSIVLWGAATAVAGFVRTRAKRRAARAERAVR